MSRVLVIWRESCGVRGLGHFARHNLVQGVDALPSGIEGEHKMHVGDERWCGVSGVVCGKILVAISIFQYPLQIYETYIVQREWWSNSVL